MRHPKIEITEYSVEKVYSAALKHWNQSTRMLLMHNKRMLIRLLARIADQTLNIEMTEEQTINNSKSSIFFKNNRQSK